VAETPGQVADILRHMATTQDRIDSSLK